ncbi:MAG: hypothetical protein PUG38_03525, partial [Sutterellaceae bacterium]|nr:hypothetical protein [Sutterellaceae bacterium]
LAATKPRFGSLREPEQRHGQGKPEPVGTGFDKPSGRARNAEPDKEAAEKKALLEMKLPLGA